MPSPFHAGVGNYLEFKTVDAIYYIREGGEGVVRVPSSKADIFTSSLLHALEKRALMKFLQVCDMCVCVI